MKYEILVNGYSLLRGDIVTLIFISFVTLLILAGIIVTVFRKLQENEVLKYEFITIIAHKFRTPLTHLKWLLEELVANEQDSSNREGLVDLQQSTDKLINLTGTLIELTNADTETKSSYQMEVIPLCEMTKNVANVYKNAFRDKNITFTIRCDGEEIFAKADKIRLEFVLQTLLENAYNYTPSGREVVVSVTPLGKKGQISVKDNGIGIDPKDLDKIVHKFYRAENAKVMDTEGFGVGLYLAQTVLKRFNAKIEVSSEGLNHGSTFSIVLPLEKK